MSRIQKGSASANALAGWTAHEAYELCHSSVVRMYVPDASALIVGKMPYEMHAVSWRSEKALASEVR